MIEVKDACKMYGKKENSFLALKNVSFKIKEGSTTAIIGKSGSGKSTLMHAMSGLDSITSGQIIIGNRDITQLKKRDLNKFRYNEIGFIFQSFFIEPNQSVYQNVALPLEIAGVPFLSRKEIIMEALSNVELTDKARSLARNLSGGQKQRLAIARAIVNKPKIIFADEPTGNLDSKTGEAIIKLLFKMNQELGTTLIVVTHDHDLADLCQNQIRISDGMAALHRTESSKKGANK